MAGLGRGEKRAAIGPGRHRHQEWRQATISRHAGALRCAKIFYRADRGPAPHTSLPSRAIAADDGWCDAPDDPNYKPAGEVALSRQRRKTCGGMTTSTTWWRCWVITTIRWCRAKGVPYSCMWPSWAIADTRLCGAGLSGFAFKRSSSCGGRSGCYWVKQGFLVLLMRLVRPVPRSARSAAGG